MKNTQIYTHSLVGLMLSATLAACPADTTDTTDATDATDATASTGPADLTTTDAPTTSIGPTTDDPTTDATTTADTTGATTMGGENLPPGSPEVAIDPAMPSRKDSLTCTITGESIDPDGDPVTYAFSWTRDGADAGIAGDTVPADQLEIGEEWVCLATPNDGAVDGMPGLAMATILPACAGLEFDGVDDAITADHISANVWTVEAWIYQTDADGQQAIVSQIDNVDEEFMNFEIGVENGVPYAFAPDGGTWHEIFNNNPISLNSWHHIAGIYDGTTLTLAVDGVINPESLVSMFIEGSEPLTIGARPNGFSRFKGTVYEARVSSVARYDAQFEPEVGLVPNADTLGLWRLDEGTGTLAADSSDAANDGAIAGMAAWTMTCPDFAGNTAPNAPVVSISPAMPTREQDLKCAVDVESTDPEGDPITYAFAWQKNGVDAMIAGDTVTADELEVGDEWTCVVTPSDGKSSGAVGEATVTVSPPCVSLKFDGVNDIVNALHVHTMTWTVEAWFYPTKMGGEQAIVSQINDTMEEFKNFELGTLNGRPYIFGPNGVAWNMVVTADPVTMNEWHHIAGIYDGVAVRLAVDGVLEDQVIPSAFSNGTIPLHIGGRPGDPYWFGGEIFEVRVSSLARYEDDFVPQIGFAPDADTLALYRLDEGMGTMAADSSAQNNDGTIVGPTWTTNCPGM